MRCTLEIQNIGIGCHKGVTLYNSGTSVLFIIFFIIINKTNNSRKHKTFVRPNEFLDDTG